MKLSEQVHVKCLHMPRYMTIAHYWLALIIQSQYSLIPLGILIIWVKAWHQISAQVFVINSIVIVIVEDHT